MLVNKTCYFGRFAHCLKLTTLEIVDHGVICVEDGGGSILCIHRVGIDYTASDAASLEPSELYGKLLHPYTEGASIRFEEAPKNHFFFPGLIDSHIHASQYPCVGISKGFSLLEWLREIILPQEIELDDVARATRVYEQCVRSSLSAGTTTAAYYATHNVDSTKALARVVRDLGQRAFIGRCAMDQKSPHVHPDVRDKAPKESRDSTLKILNYCKNEIDADRTGRVQGIVTPRFALGCTIDALKLHGELLNGDDWKDLRCQTHISENVGEINAVKAQFPGYRSYADVYDRCGLLTDRTVLGHAVYLTDEEVALVHLKGAGIAHCPVSNLALGSGDAKVRSWLNAGINVGLGTDVAGGHEINILAVARTACLVSRSVAHTQGEGAKLTAEEALYLATRGGAKVLKLEDKVGYFKPGMKWDACLVGLDMFSKILTGERDEITTCDGAETPEKNLEKWRDWIEKWLFVGDDRNIRKVWVDGKLAHPRPGTLPGVLEVREGITGEE